MKTLFLFYSILFTYALLFIDTNPRNFILISKTYFETEKYTLGDFKLHEQQCIQINAHSVIRDIVACII